LNHLRSARKQEERYEEAPKISKNKRNLFNSHLGTPLNSILSPKSQERLSTAQGRSLSLNRPSLNSRRKTRMLDYIKSKENERKNELLNENKKNKRELERKKILSKLNERYKVTNNLYELNNNSSGKVDKVDNVNTRELNKHMKPVTNPPRLSERLSERISNKLLRNLNFNSVRNRKPYIFIKDLPSMASSQGLTRQQVSDNVRVGGGYKKKFNQTRRKKRYKKKTIKYFKR
jgi:hypothetical protein